MAGAFFRETRTLCGVVMSTLNAQDLFVLDTLLRKYQTLPLVGAHGFLAATLCAPEDRPLVEVLPYLFGGQLPPFEYDEQQTVLNLLQILREDIQGQFEENIESFEPLAFLEKAKEVEAQVQEDAISMWCLGFLHGLRMDAEYWQQDESQKFDPHFAVLMILAAKDDKDNQALGKLNDSLKIIYRK